jgi:hypothetical protein
MLKGLLGFFLLFGFFLQFWLIFSVAQEKLSVIWLTVRIMPKLTVIRIKIYLTEQTPLMGHFLLPVWANLRVQHCYCLPHPHDFWGPLSSCTVWSVYNVCIHICRLPPSAGGLNPTGASDFLGVSSLFTTASVAALGLSSSRGWLS